MISKGTTPFRTIWHLQEYGEAIWEAASGEKWGLLREDETPKPSWHAQREYAAAHPPDDSWREAREAERREAERKLDGVANRIADLARTGGPADAHHPL